MVGILSRNAAISMPGVIFVAIGNTHQRVGAMGIDHVFQAVGNQVPRRQAIEHAVMAHGDPVIDGDRVEFLGDAA